MNIPVVTHIQVLVLTAVKGEPRPGDQIRNLLQDFGVDNSLASFYQLAKRMEVAELLRGEYFCESVEGQIVRKRQYSITCKGRKVLAEVHSFYEKLKSLE